MNSPYDVVVVGARVAGASTALLLARAGLKVAMVDRTAETYRRQLIAVTNMIHAKPRRIRQFADAFKFKKDR